MNDANKSQELIELIEPSFEEKVQEILCLSGENNPDICDQIPENSEKSHHVNNPALKTIDLDEIISSFAESLETSKIYANLWQSEVRKNRTLKLKIDKKRKYRLDKREFRNNLRKIREQDLEIRRNKSKIDALEKIVIEQENEIQELSRKIERQNMMIRTQEAANNQQREDIKDQEDMFSLFSNL